MLSSILLGLVLDTIIPSKDFGSNHGGNIAFLVFGLNETTRDCLIKMLLLCLLVLCKYISCSCFNCSFMTHNNPYFVPKKSYWTIILKISLWCDFLTLHGSKTSIELMQSSIASYEICGGINLEHIR